MAFDWQTEYHRYHRYFVDIGQLYKKRKKVRVYTGIILSLLTTSFFLFFAIKPTLTTIAGLVRTIKDQKLVAEQLQAKINALGLAQTEYNSVQDDIFLIDEALPTETQISTLTKQLEALARQSEVTIEALKFNQVYLKGNVPEAKDQKIQAAQSINFSLAASGEYQNLKSFLQSLSSLRRVVLIESFAFKTGKTEGQILILSLNAQAFYLKED